MNATLKKYQIPVAAQTAPVTMLEIDVLTGPLFVGFYPAIEWPQTTWGSLNIQFNFEPDDGDAEFDQGALDARSVDQSGETTGAGQIQTSWGDTTFGALGGTINVTTAGKLRLQVLAANANNAAQEDAPLISGCLFWG